MKEEPKSTCCSAPMRYIDEFLCCASCGKETVPHSSTTPEGYKRQFEKDFKYLGLSSPILDRIEQFIDTLLSTQKQEFKKVIEEAFEVMLRVVGNEWSEEERFGCVKRKKTDILSALELE